MRKRLLSIALCICLALSLLPTAALAEGNGELDFSKAVVDETTFTIGGTAYTYKGDTTNKRANFAITRGYDIAALAGDFIYKAGEGYILYSHVQDAATAAVTLHGAHADGAILPCYGEYGNAMVYTGVDTTVTLEGASTLSDILSHAAGSTTFLGTGTLALEAGIPCDLSGAVIIGGGAQVTLGNGTEQSCIFNNTLTVKSGAKLTIAANAELMSGSIFDSAANPGGITVENGGTLENNGVIRMVTKEANVSNIPGGITGVGVVCFGTSNDATPYINAGGEWKACNAGEDVSDGEVTIGGVTYIKFSGAWVTENSTVTIGGKTYTYKGDATEAGNSGLNFAPEVGNNGGWKPLEGNLVWKAGGGYILYSYQASGSSAAVTLHEAESAKSIGLPFSQGSGPYDPATGCDTTVTLEGTSTLSGCLYHEAGSTTFAGSGTLSLTQTVACDFGGPVIIKNGAHVTVGNGDDSKTGYFYQPLTVKSGATLTVAANAMLWSGNTVENSGTLVNNGTLQMSNKTAANPGITGEITGTGVVHFGSDNTTAYIKVGSEWLGSGGDKSSEALDLSTAPAAKTLYTAGTNGTILWEPTTNGDPASVTGGTLTFDGATMDVTSGGTTTYAVTLPSLTNGVNVVFKGTNSITANNNTNATAIKCPGDTTFDLTEDSDTTLTAKNAQNASGIGVYGGSTDNTAEITGTGKLTVIANGGVLSCAINAGSHSVKLAGGTLDFSGKVDGTVTLGSITIPEGKTLDLSTAASVTQTVGTTVVNNGTLKLKDGFDLTTLSLTGTGSVMVGDNTMTKLNGEWVADGGEVPTSGLDLTTAPTVKTVYTADTGTIIWNPTLDDNSVVSSGKLTLNNAKINLMSIASSAITLPSVPVTVELLGTSTITSSAQQPGYAVFVGTGDVTLTGSGSIIAKTSGYFIKTDGAVTLKGGTRSGIIYAPAGATLDGVTFQTLDLREVTGEISATGAVNNGTLQLPATTTVEQIKALGLTGTGLVMVRTGDDPEITHYYRNDGTAFPYRTEALDLTSGNHNAATLAADGYTLTGDAANGYVLTLGDLMITSEAITPAIKLPTDGKVEVKLTGNTRVSTGGYGMQFAKGTTEYPCTISGSGTLTLNCGGVALVSTQPLTITGGNITATNSAGFGISATNLTITGGTITVSGSNAAFAAAPTFSGYTPKVTAGNTVLDAAAVSAPKDTTYTDNKYVKIEKYVSAGSSGYTLTFETNGGSAIAKVSKAYGVTVDLAAYVPTRTGYTFAGWYSDAALTEKVSSVKLTKSMTVYAKWTLAFADVSEGAYYYDAVVWALHSGVTGGTSAAAFSPNRACTRAQTVTFLWRAMGSPEPTAKTNPFTDVKADAYYYKAVLWAVENGVTKGVTATTFAPDATVTRAQVVTFQWRAAGKPAATAGSPFTDVAANTYCADAVLWAVSEKITDGTTATTFSPAKACTRAQIVTFLYRQLGK